MKLHNMKLQLVGLQIALLALSVSGQSISYVPHRDISPISTPLDGPYSNWQYRHYQPAVKVLNGCVPFPAVGEYTASRGLRLGGARNGLCSSSPGQVYAKHMDFAHINLRGIMYAYYFPKDQVFAGNSYLGHRHDWEEVIVWVSWDWSRALGASMSGHGDYTIGKRHWIGSHYAVFYANGNTINGISHEFRTDVTKTGYYQHPLANWFQMSDASRFTLNNAAWLDQRGKQRAEPKIKDSQFESKMRQACRGFWGS